MRRWQDRPGSTRPGSAIDNNGRQNVGFNLDDYEPVEDRLRKFWQDHPKGRVDTYVDVRADVAVARCTLYGSPDDATGKIHPRSSGWACNKLGQTGKTAQATHPIEDAETSAIGRALANWVYASEDKPRPSREEMRSAEPKTVDLLHLVEDMNEDERVEFASIIKTNWPGLGLKEVPHDLVGPVVEYALQIASDRYAQPQDTADVSEFSEEPF